VDDGNGPASLAEAQLALVCLQLLTGDHPSAALSVLRHLAKPKARWPRPFELRTLPKCEVLMAESENKRHIRRTLADLAERNSDVLQKFFEDAMAADRTISVQCPNCRHRHQVDVPDWRARGQAVAELLNQGYGRPGTEAGETGGQLTVIRRLVLPDGRELDGGAPGAGPVIDSK
jgi:hypothetical protein